MAKGKELIRGTPAVQGVATGIVRVVDMNIERFEKLSQGEILVAERTNPKHEIYMKKVAAIVTDVGGKTSHPAIVAREFGIPCIVGTAEGTTVLKDGQKVVVDATEGVVYEYIPEVEKPLSQRLEEQAKKSGIYLPPEILKRLVRGE